MSNQPGIHDKTFSQESDDRIKAAKQLGALFEVFPDRKQAFEDLLRLCSDRDSEVRVEAINSLTTVFPNVPEKELTWERFVNLTAYPVEQVFTAAVNALITVFPLVPDKGRAWKDLIELINSKSSIEDVSRGIVSSLQNIISEYPDREHAWKDLLEMTASEEPYARKKAASLLSMVFPGLPEGKKTKAWKDLLGLAGENGDLQVREQASKTIREVFPFLPDEKKDEGWEEMLELAGGSADHVARMKILPFLPSVFSSVPDKNKAWDTIFRFTGDERETVRKQAMDALVSISTEMSDKSRVWSDFIKLTEAQDEYVRDRAVDALSSVYQCLENKDAAWKELIELTGSEEENIRTTAARALNRIFPYVSDKSQAYSDIIDLAEKEDNYMLREVARNLSSIHPQFYGEYGTDEMRAEIGEINESGRQNGKKEDKFSGFSGPASEKAAFLRRDTATFRGSAPGQHDMGKNREIAEGREMRDEDKAENGQLKGKESKKSAYDFLRLKGEREKYARKDSAGPFSETYSGIPEKKEIIEELLRLSSDPDPQIRRGAIETLLVRYSREAGKAQDIWNELLRISEDEDTGVRKDAAELLSHVFPAVEEKSGVFFDIIRLVESRDTQLRRRAAELLPAAFAHSGNKQRAWNDLVKLTSDEDREVRKGAVLALSSGYPGVPDKGKVWSDLIMLSSHNDSFVQREATRALGPAFFYVPDKTMAWRDLQVLVDNPYVYVRRYALRSLGRASLWRAMKAENEAAYLFGLKEAVKYFKEASEASVGTAIPEFYHPFYESLLQIFFAERSSALESERYLSAVTGETGYLAENRKLQGVLEEFAGLLRTAGDLAPGDLSARKEFLENSTGAFDRASSIFDAVEEDAILSKKVVKKERQKFGKVVQEQKLKETLSGIRYRAKTACLKSKGTPAEKITCSISQRVRTWNFQDSERDKNELSRQLESFLNVLEAQVPYVPENRNIFEKLEDIRQEQDLLERCRKVSRLISLIPGARV